MRRTSTLLLGALLLPLPGCCSLARLFCGPDRSAWVQIDYSTPAKAVRTLLEAIRRDEPEVVYDALASEFRESMKLDRDLARLAWQRIKEQTPGIHLAGYAEIPEPVHTADQGATVVLDVEGKALRIDLVRESVWEVEYTKDDGSRGDAAQRQTSWNTVVRLEPIADSDPDSSRLTIGPVVFPHEGQGTVPLEQLHRVELVRRWKVARLQMAP